MVKDTPHKVRAKYFDLDYNNEIAIVAEMKEGQRGILGLSWPSIDLEEKSGDVAFILADPWKEFG